MEGGIPCRLPVRVCGKACPTKALLNTPGRALVTGGRHIEEGWGGSGETGQAEFLGMVGGKEKRANLCGSSSRLNESAQGVGVTQPCANDDGQPSSRRPSALRLIQRFTLIVNEQ